MTSQLGSQNARQRIVIVGTSGSGKSTMSRALSKRLDLKHVEVDSLFWRPGWNETPDDEFLPKVDEATSGPRWVIDGNYAQTRPLVWPRADTVVWLDYRFPRIFSQLLRRTATRCISGEKLWNGCVEHCWPQLTSRDSVLWWSIKTYRPHRREYPRVLAEPAHRHLDVYRFRTPRQARMWLESL